MADEQSKPSVENALAVFGKGPLPSRLASRQVEPPCVQRDEWLSPGKQVPFKGFSFVNGHPTSPEWLINFHGKAQRVLLTSGNIRAPLAQDTTRRHGHRPPLASPVVGVHVGGATRNLAPRSVVLNSGWSELSRAA